MGKLRRIKVKAILLASRPCFVLRWKQDGKDHQESTNIPAHEKYRIKANKLAFQKEEEINQPISSSCISWLEFCKRYRIEHLSGLSANSTKAWKIAKKHLETHCKIVYLSDVDSSTLSHLISKLRQSTISEASIASYLRQLKAALSWAYSINLIASLPKLQPPKRSKGKTKKMRSRPITEQEYQHLLKCVPLALNIRFKILLWENLIKGLYLSGLRIGEALKLSWDKPPIQVDLTGKYPCLKIYSEGEKSHEDRLLPLSPEFCEFLLSTPEVERKGLVFKLKIKEQHAIKTISRIGKYSGIKTGDSKHVTAHDLRRTFGTRWASKLSPSELQTLMRHSDISTTMDYYVSHQADILGDKLRGTE